MNFRPTPVSSCLVLVLLAGSVVGGATGVHAVRHDGSDGARLTVQTCEAEANAVDADESTFLAANERSRIVSMAYAKAAEGLIEAEGDVLDRVPRKHHLAVVSAFLPIWHGLNSLAVLHATAARNEAQAALETVLASRRALATCRGR